jgi:hypothetical protein
VGYCDRFHVPEAKTCSINAYSDLIEQVLASGT